MSSGRICSGHIYETHSSYGHLLCPQIETTNV